MPTPDSSPNSIRWRTALVAIFTLAIVGWFVWSMDFAKVSIAMRDAHLGWIAGTVAVMLQTYAIRAWRWQLLLRPLGRARFRTAFRTSVIGFASSFLLPGRVGEVLRPYLLARTEGFHVTPALATVVVERVLDLVVILLLLGGFLVTTSIDVRSHEELWSALRWGGITGAVFSVFATAVLVLAAHHPERMGAWSSRLGRFLPARAAAQVAQIAQAFAEGLGAMRSLRASLAALGLSVLLWLSIALGIWLASLAFDLTFPFPATFLVMMFLVVGVAVPTPAGVGSFHWMYRLCVTTFFDVEPDTAAAAAIVLHAATVLPVIVLGLIFMAQDGLTLGRLREASGASRPDE